jgi:hypothetical protein
LWGETACAFVHCGSPFVVTQESQEGSRVLLRNWRQLIERLYSIAGPRGDKFSRRWAGT